MKTACYWQFWFSDRFTGARNPARLSTTNANPSKPLRPPFDSFYHCTGAPVAFRNIFTQPGNASEGCPRCSSPLSADDINVAADTALCRKCGSAFSLSELLHYGRDFNIVDPPRGVSYQEASGGFIVTATTRSWAALFVVPFAGYCILAFGGPFGALIREAEFSQTQLLFVLPFVICVLGMLVTTLMWSIGVVKVRRDGDDGAVFTGIGPFGWARRFR